MGRVFEQVIFCIRLLALSHKRSPGGNQNFWLGDIQPEVEREWGETGRTAENIPGLPTPQGNIYESKQKRCIPSVPGIWIKQPILAGDCARPSGWTEFVVCF